MKLIIGILEGHKEMIIVKSVQNEFAMFDNNKVTEWEDNYAYVNYVLSTKATALNKRTLKLFEGFHPTAQPEYVTDALVSILRKQSI